VDFELYCAYCGSPKGERLQCCGETHWLTREEYIEDAGEDPRDTVMPHPADTPDYRTAAEYYADKARAERWNRLWGDD
jgi:hypothetical protein